MPNRIVTVTELKTQLASFVARLEAEGARIYVTQHGKPRAVLVEYQQYEALLKKLDDLEDALAMHQAMSIPVEEAMSLDGYERQRGSQVEL